MDTEAITRADGRTGAYEAALIKRRVEACVSQARLNAQAHGGNFAIATADLICAFVLLASKSGADPDKMLAAVWDHAKGTVADFWPSEAVN